MPILHIEHNNCLQAYVSDWRSTINLRARVRGEPPPAPTNPQPSQALSRQTINLCILLELLEGRLTRLERSLEGKKEDFDYGAYPEAMFFLDAFYMFSRMLMDITEGVVKHFHRYNFDGDILPDSFDDIFKKAKKEELPGNFNKVFSGVEKWFPDLRQRRVGIVHGYETLLLCLKKESDGEITAHQLSSIRKNHSGEPEEIRSYIGKVMAGYQSFVDKLLDYWDEMRECKPPRSPSILAGQMANILWWASQYGRYENKNMIVH